MQTRVAHLFAAVSAVLLAPGILAAPPTRASFDLATPQSGPFPSDRFTVADPTNTTGLRVHLPMPDCVQRPSDCEDVAVINTLDGFNVQPRLSIPFEGPIDVQSVTSHTVFLLKLPCAHSEEGCDHRPTPLKVGINQVVWDTFSNTLHVESDELLDQHARYALIVTNGVRDPLGAAVGASPAFHRFTHDLNFGHTRDGRVKQYRKALRDAVATARLAGVRESDIVSASVFSTQSATSILENIRDQIKAGTPEPANFDLGSNGERTVFPLDTVSGITVNQQTGDSPPRFTAVQPALSVLRMVPGAVGRIAFGKYFSPDYLVHPGEYIPRLGTRTGMPQPQGVSEIYFNLYLPSGPMPAAGWPVAIFGHGSSVSKNTNGGPLNAAAVMASHGIASIGINVVGNGYGPLGTLTVNPTVGSPVTLSAGGRGTDQNGDGVITDREGLRAAPPRTIIDAADGLLQTVADLMQLVRVIEVGVDADGDTMKDLDPSRLYYFGQSLGGIYGTAFLAVEPQVRAGVPNVPGGALGELQRLSAPGGRPIIASRLAARQPSLLNDPGILGIDGVQTPGPYFFNENVPLRDGVPLAVSLSDGTSDVIQSPVVNTVAGAMEIQEYLDRTEWVMQAANAVVYSRHLLKTPLDGVPAKPVIIQFARGDLTVPNPTTTAMLRAGDFADRATYFRNDIAFAENSAVPRNPHGFMLMLGSPLPLVVSIALGAQEQIALFFASDGALVVQPEPNRFFEVPIFSPLPEDVGFIP
jgi:Bacterial virulence factor lipase N-terminal